VAEPFSRRPDDIAVSAFVRAAAAVRAAAERARSLQAAAEAIVDVVDGSAARFYQGARLKAAKGQQSTVDDEAVLAALLAGPYPKGMTVARDLGYAGRVGAGMVAFGGDLAAGARFAVIVEVGQSVDVGANGLLAVAAAARAGLLHHGVDAQAGERLEAVRDAGNRVHHRERGEYGIVTARACNNGGSVYIEYIDEEGNPVKVPADALDVIPRPRGRHQWQARWCR